MYWEGRSPEWNLPHIHLLLLKAQCDRFRRPPLPCRCLRPFGTAFIRNERHGEGKRWRIASERDQRAVRDREAWKGQPEHDRARVAILRWDSGNTLPQRDLRALRDLGARQGELAHDREGGMRCLGAGTGLPSEHRRGVGGPAAITR